MTLRELRRQSGKSVKEVPKEFLGLLYVTMKKKAREPFYRI